MTTNGPSLGAVMAVREFKCPLCGRQFTRWTGDLITTEVTVCDECLAELGPIGETALRKEIERRQAERAASDTLDPS
jgi:ribosome-binding protein aMBF1 (putative translation factor)